MKQLFSKFLVAFLLIYKVWRVKKFMSRDGGAQKVPVTRIIYFLFDFGLVLIIVTFEKKNDRLLIFFNTFLRFFDLRNFGHEFIVMSIHHFFLNSETIFEQFDP